MAKATGIGGIFIRCKDEATMKKWYKDALGLDTNDYGVLFTFNSGKRRAGHLQLGTFPIHSDYFGNEMQQYMLNFRVDNLHELVKHLKKMKVEIVDDIQSYDYGKFVHIIDPDGNRVELWEPTDVGFEDETGVEMS